MKKYFLAPIGVFICFAGITLYVYYSIADSLRKFNKLI